MTHFKKRLVWLVVLVILGGLVYGGYRYWQMRQGIMEMIAQAAAGGMGGAGGAMPMPVDRCTIRDITDFLEYTGATEAKQDVVVRARVAGYLQAIHFTDGQFVEEGQLLFTIEPDAYRARRDEAAAMLKAAQTEMQRAADDLERIEKAVETGAVSRQELTRARAAYDTAQAQELGHQATLTNAELDISYTQVRSPIAGRIGRRLVDVGNLVGGAEATPLATIKQTAPIYVFFHISEHLLKGDFLRRLQGDGQPLTLAVGLPAEGGFPYQGAIDFVNNTVDTGTGTIYVRGQLPNEDETLLPGMFVRVQVPVAEHKDAVLIPEKAVSTDLGGKFLLVVGDDNILQRRDITLGALVNGLRVITDGLTGEETFIVGGFHMARPGMPIEPMREGEMPSPMMQPPMPNAADEMETED